MTRERALAHDSRVALLHELHRSRVPLDAATLAEAVGLHVSTVRSHLAQLVDAGLVGRETERRTDPGRPRQLYRAHDQPEERERYSLLARMLASYIAATAPDPASAAEETGREWGRHLTPPTAPFATTSADDAHRMLIGILDDLGFAPRTQGPDRIDLRHCPFRDVAQAHPQVVCAAHLGLMRGALGQLDTALDVDDLLPFVEPDRCVVTLSAGQLSRTAEGSDVR